MATANTSPADTGVIETLVRQWLAGRAHVRDLRVTLLNEGIVLEGRAATYYAKQLAQHVVVKVLGLPLGSNRIEVHSESKGAATGRHPVIEETSWRSS